ncbi:MAG: RluA family pseudouridine synthase [Bacilli bacterium]|nr:RluA family pseudouridine synthase [Bacilli bacterium]
MNKLEVLYEDNHIIVVVKPYNVLSQGDSTGDTSIMDMVKEYIKVKYHKPGNVYLGLVHRLDRPVGGIMVFARSSKAAARLTKAFNEHKITKKYLAIVHGKMEKEKDTLVDKIEKTSDGNSIISENGKEAILDYEVLEYNKEKDCSLVSIVLKTGRHHQIRVQFASRGHYLLGDQRYGVLDNKQISLFSYYLSFTHPVTKEVLEFRRMPDKKDYWTIFTL